MAALVSLAVYIIYIMDSIFRARRSFDHAPQTSDTRRIAVEMFDIDTSHLGLYSDRTAIEMATYAQPDYYRHYDVNRRRGNQVQPQSGKEAFHIYRLPAS